MFLLGVPLKAISPVATASAARGGDQPKAGLLDAAHTLLAGSDGKTRDSPNFPPGSACYLWT